MFLTSLVAIGPWQILLIVVVVLFLFGGKRISEFMGGFGKGIKEFNIGHFLIGESIFEGLGNTIKKFKKVIK